MSIFLGTYEMVTSLYLRAALRMRATRGRLEAGARGPTRARGEAPGGNALAPAERR